ncbi:MAG: response regulator [Bdellovibrionota bacterium]
MDDMDTQIIHQKMILGSHYDYLVARDAADCLRIANTNVPNLIVLDLMLPDLNGLEVCRKLKANQKTRQIPVVLVSAATASLTQDRASFYGCDAVVEKPLDRTAFRSAISGLLLEERREP